MSSSEYGYGETDRRSWDSVYLALCLSVFFHTLLLWAWPERALHRSVLLQVRLPDLAQGQLAGHHQEKQSPRTTLPVPGAKKPAVTAGQARPRADWAATVPERAQSFVQLGEDSVALRAYRLAVAQVLARQPELWPRFVGAGEWGARLDVGASGRIMGVSVLQASGSRARDQAVRLWLYRAAQQASVPQTLRGQAFSVVLWLEWDSP